MKITWNQEGAGSFTYFRAMLGPFLCASIDRDPCREHVWRAWQADTDTPIAEACSPEAAKALAAAWIADRIAEIRRDPPAQTGAPAK